VTQPYGRIWQKPVNSRDFTIRWDESPTWQSAKQPIRSTQSGAIVATDDLVIAAARLAVATSGQLFDWP
jgi:hypothetical protein